MQIKQYMKSSGGQRSLRAIGFFIAFYFGLIVFTALSQERLVYLPSDQDFYNCPAVTSLGQTAQEHDGTRFYGPASVSSSSKLVVVYHGNAGSACNRTYYLPYIAEASAEAVLVEYQGYSNDVRSPSHVGVKSDVHNIVDWLDQNNVEEVTILGESIGTGPAVLHASLRAPVNLILVTPFTSIKDLAKHHYWYFPTDLLVKNAFDNYSTLALYNGPRTFIHGTKDEIVPFFMSEQLAKIEPEDTNLSAIENAGHNDLLWFTDFESALATALSQQ